MATTGKRACKLSESVLTSPATNDLYEPEDFSEGSGTDKFVATRQNSSNLYEPVDSEPDNANELGTGEKTTVNVPSPNTDAVASCCLGAQIQVTRLIQAKLSPALGFLTNERPKKLSQLTVKVLDQNYTMEVHLVIGRFKEVHHCAKTIYSSRIKPSEMTTTWGARHFQDWMTSVNLLQVVSQA